MSSKNIAILLKKLDRSELNTLDSLLQDVANTSSSPQSQNRLSEWVEHTSLLHGIEQHTTPRRRRSLSL
tara:strand:- start:507 stop:713 length:207 start_codon:yes stop_codon:yes gene_type:complete